MRALVVEDVAALTVHPAADLFPLLGERELRELADDIGEHGLLSPIVLKDGEVVDGRNRLKACELAGVTPHFVAWTGAGSVTAWVFSVNLRRRHLSTAQRAMLAARSVELFRAEADARMRAGLAVTGDVRGKAADQAADVFDVGTRTVFRAQTVLDRAAPELVKAVEAGEVPVAAAAEVATLSPDEQRAAVRDGNVAARAKEVRQTRKPPASPLAPEPSAVALHASSPSSGLATTTAAVERTERPDEFIVAETGEADEEDERDLPSRPIPPPIKLLGLTQFRSAYVRGTCPADELPYLEQIRDALRSALLGWRATVIQWQAPPPREDMLFAFRRAGEIAMHMQKALTEIELVLDGCRAVGPGS